MRLQKLKVEEILFRRPGINKIRFTADYGKVLRRGVVIYDVVNKKFLSHGRDLELLSSICLALMEPKLVCQRGEQRDS